MTARVVLVAAFLALQLVVPAFALFAPRPAPFGWQMYSALAETPHAWMIDASGAETEVDMSAVFARHRAELDYTSILVAGLCGTDGVAAIRIEPASAGSRTVQCGD